MLSIISLSLIRASFQEERETTTHSLWEEIREGLLWIWHQPLIRYLALLTGCVNLTLVSCELIIIVIAKGLHISPYFIGVIFTVGGIGSTMGALLSSPIQKRFSFGRIVIVICWHLPPIFGSEANHRYIFCFPGHPGTRNNMEFSYTQCSNYYCA